VKPHRDVGMDFEMTMRLLFGQRAYHIAGEAMHPPSRRQWLREALRKIMVIVNKLDTAPHHKEVLLRTLNDGKASLKEGDSSWPLVISLMRLSIHLLGFEYATGTQFQQPIYSRDWGQYYTARSHNRGTDSDALDESHNDKQNAIVARRRLVQQLSDNGMNTFQIALVLNTSEYEVKRLRRTVRS